METQNRLERDNREATLLLPPEIRRDLAGTELQENLPLGEITFFFKREPFCWASTHGELKTEDGAQTLRCAL